MIFTLLFSITTSLGYADIDITQAENLDEIYSSLQYNYKSQSLKESCKFQLSKGLFASSCIEFASHFPLEFSNRKTWNSHWEKISKNCLTSVSQVYELKTISKMLLVKEFNSQCHLALKNRALDLQYIDSQ